MEIIVDLCNQHHGSLSELKRMSLNAFASGADTVKVQLMDSEKHFGTKEKKYRDISYDSFMKLNDFCTNIGIRFLATPFDMERLGWIQSAGHSRIKIASKTVKQDPELCEAILRSRKNLIVSTGACSLGEFPFGINSRIKYLFCVSKYPTYLHDEGLKNMPTEFKEDGYAGFSDHTIGITAALEAYLNGASILEKHYSENINAQSKNEGAHVCSFDRESLKQYKDLIKEFAILRG